MRKFSFVFLSAPLFALSVPAQGQQAAKVFRIGFMAGVSPPPAEPSRSLTSKLSATDYENSVISKEKT
jgi:hypothetical protein